MGTSRTFSIHFWLNLAKKKGDLAPIYARVTVDGKRAESGADIELTAKIKNAADFLDIKILDHIIIAPDGGFYSMADNGLI